ncbi:hypothetical protein MUN74_13710 [Agromyces endophyticus]|uniref:hypothetical protein n=1 Tax=Agromyces sp. H17E-10 TaxID=2932244 RepID=UPI001FD214A7|nr:hypothetical protein [Agromyces sp. H17E-10]UOQ88330.1 hypothetical protein MUN74_13710 [Agromyces sp. H17E-10]
MTNAELQARIAQLEGENAQLRERAETAAAAAAEAAANAESAAEAASAATPRTKRGRGRTAGAIVLVVIGLLLAPVAVVTSWARAELVDTDQFVATFAPLAKDPAVQSFVSDEVTTAIEKQVDIPQLTSDVFDGIRSLDLPPKAEQALGLLEAPAVQGLQSLVSGVVDRVITSDAFADIWANALRVSHKQFIAAMQDDPNAALEIGGDGTLSVQLGPIIEAVKQRLVDNGVGFASSIPVVDQSIVIAQADAFVFVRTVYALALGVGTWLPWVALAFIVAGVFVAKRRSAALFWTAGGFTLVMALLASGFAVGQVVFLGAVSPSLIPAGAATAIYGYITEAMASTTAAAVVLGLLVTIIAWFAGPWRPARAVRGFAGSGFSSLRRTAAAHGVTTGAFGIALDRFRGFAYGAIALIAALVLMFNRPVTTGAIWGTLIVALIAVLLVELLRRPADEIEADAAAPTSPVTATADEAVGFDAAVADEESDDADTAVLDVDRQETEPLDGPLRT